jgi:CelD/BcsL family acetyltransferase involved in cellulose biosynthesis
MNEESAGVVLEQASSFDALRDDWNLLAERSDNVFGTWEWASAWWRHFGRRARLLVTTCRRADGSMLALLPLYVWPRPGLQVVRLIGHGPADELGPLCAAEDRPAAAAALTRVLDDARADVFLGEEVRHHDGWSRRLGATVRGTVSSPVLRLDWRSWDEFLAARSSNFRQQIRRRERALGDHGLRYRLCENRDRLERDLDVLFALHRLRWTGGDSEFTRLAAFHRDFAADAFDRGWLRLWFLEVNGAEVAAWYGLRFRGIEWYYQAGRDPAWDRFAVGFVLLAHSIREAIADGMREYRLGRGDEEYKSRFTDDDSEVETLVLARGVKGRLAVAAAEAARRRTGTRRFVRSTLRT